MEQTEKRMAGDYEIIHALRIGDKEIVIGENCNAAEDKRYMCAFCSQNEIFRRYDDLVVSDDYPDIVMVYGKRIEDQAHKTRTELFKPILQGINLSPLTKADCAPITADSSILNQVVVMDAKKLRREYQRSTNQLYYCFGGFGASPRSRGSACFCVDLYSGEKTRIERQDILGTLTDENIPQWARLQLDQYLQKQRSSSREGR